MYLFEAANQLRSEEVGDYIYIEKNDLKKPQRWTFANVKCTYQNIMKININ